MAAPAKKHNIPVVGIAGSLGWDIEVVNGYGIDAVFSILDKCRTLPEAAAETAESLELTARNIAKLLKMGL